jgi:hypothetical protein
MRKAAGIALIFLGLIGLGICGLVLFHLPLPAPGWFLRHKHTIGVFLDPIEGPLFSIISLTIGVLLLRTQKVTLTKRV